jgi:hypothetical protein
MDSSPRLRYLLSLSPEFLVHACRIPLHLVGASLGLGGLLVFTGLADRFPFKLADLWIPELPTYWSLLCDRFFLICPRWNGQPAKDISVDFERRKNCYEQLFNEHQD